MGTSQDSGEGAPGTSSDNQGILNTMTSRVKLNFKVLGVQVNIISYNLVDLITYTNGLLFIDR